MIWVRVARNTEKWCAPADSVGANPVTVFVRPHRSFLSTARLIHSTPPCNVEVNTRGVKTAEEEEDNLLLWYRRCNLQFSLHISEYWQGGDEASGCRGRLGGKGINRRCSTERVNCLLPVTFTFRITAVFNSCFRSTALDLTTNINLWQVDCKVVKKPESRHRTPESNPLQPV
jgi:hypothetical protein